MALSQPMSGPLHLPKESPSAPARTALPSRPMTTRQPPAQLFGARRAESTSSDGEGSATAISPTSSRMDESRYATSNPTLSPKPFAREPSLGSSSRAPSEAVSGSAGQICRYELVISRFQSAATQANPGTATARQRILLSGEDPPKAPPYAMRVASISRPGMQPGQLT